MNPTSRTWHVRYPRATPLRRWFFGKRSNSLFALIASVALVAAWGQTVSAQVAVPVTPVPIMPAGDRNALFLDDVGNAIYLVVNLRVTNFLGEPVVVGEFTNGTQVGLWAGIVSYTGSVVWVTDIPLRPAGIVKVIPGTSLQVRWADNLGNAGTIVTF